MAKGALVRIKLHAGIYHNMSSLIRIVAVNRNLTKSLHPHKEKIATIVQRWQLNYFVLSAEELSDSDSSTAIPTKSPPPPHPPATTHSNLTIMSLFIAILAHLKAVVTMASCILII
jgi:hypothetical protein